MANPNQGDMLPSMGEAPIPTMYRSELVRGLDVLAGELFIPRLTKDELWKLAKAQLGLRCSPPEKFRYEVQFGVERGDYLQISNIAKLVSSVHPRLDSDTALSLAIENDKPGFIEFNEDASYRWHKSIAHHVAFDIKAPILDSLPDDKRTSVRRYLTEILPKNAPGFLLIKAGGSVTYDENEYGGLGKRGSVRTSLEDIVDHISLTPQDFQSLVKRYENFLGYPVGTIIKFAGKQKFLCEYIDEDLKNAFETKILVMIRKHI